MQANSIDFMSLESRTLDLKHNAGHRGAISHHRIVPDYYAVASHTYTRDIPSGQGP
jgi:hypothetical protein